jgi:uncharacterized protein YbbC (DUF1343 family)
MKTIPFLVVLLLLVKLSLPQKGGAVRNPSSAVAEIRPGAERMDLYLPLLKGKSVGIFANQTSVAGKSHIVDTLLKKGVVIKKIFAPEHGFRGALDAGENIVNSRDPVTGIPIISLYGTKNKPSPADLAGVDILVFDVQDVGVRFYTYISSFQRFLEAAIENNRPLIVLDRPNPNGFYVDGPVLDPKFKSFVGMQPIPVVYGMTIGEYGRMLIGEKWLDPSVAGDLNTIHAIRDAESKIDSIVRRQRHEQVNFGVSDFQLLVIPCQNYSHKSRYKLPVKPSPNLPDMLSVYLYPSTCFFEGTAVSLGRGTSKPFQQFGSPFFPDSLYHFTPRSMDGAKFPPLVNQVCYGYDLSKIDVLKELDGKIQLKWLLLAYWLYPHKEDFFLPSYYFNKLAGTDLLMEEIREGKTETEIRKTWEGDLRAFKLVRKKYLIYPDFE